MGQVDEAYQVKGQRTNQKVGTSIINHALGLPLLVLLPQKATVSRSSA